MLYEGFKGEGVTTPNKKRIKSAIYLGKGREGKGREGKGRKGKEGKGMAIQYPPYQLWPI